MNESPYDAIEDLLADESFRRWVLDDFSADAYFWEVWSEDPKRKNLVKKARTLVNGLPFEFSEEGVDEDIVQSEWQKLQSRTLKNSTPITSDRKVQFSIKYQFMRVAAAILLLVTIGAAMQNYLFNPLISHTTPFGEQLSLVLPDGTEINLNANTMLTYRKSHPRKVWLDGEAFFKVQKKPSSGANFMVVTDDLTIEVLGTEFNVKEKATKTEVILEEGKIKLNLKRDFQQEVFMDPGEVVTYSTANNKEVEKRQVSSQQLTSWKDGVLVFEDETLETVMERIEEIYGWTSVYQKEELSNRRISMGVPSNDLENVLTMLRRAINIEVDQVIEDKILLMH